MVRLSEGLLIFSVFLGFVAHQAGAGTELRPYWMIDPLNTCNSSFLSDLDSRGTGRGVDWLFSHKVSSNLRDEYSAVLKDYETRKNYGLFDDQFTDQLYQTQASKLSKDALKDISNKKTDSGFEKLGAAAEKEKDEPAVVAVTAAAWLYTGKPVNIKIDDWLRLKARTNLRDQNGSLLVNSIALDGAFDVNAVGDNFFPVLATEKEEYRVALTRDLPLGLRSGLAFGSTSSTVSTSLSKQLNQYLSCSLDTVHPVDGENSRLKKSEENVQVNYKINF